MGISGTRRKSQNDIDLSTENITEYWVLEMLRGSADYVLPNTFYNSFEADILVISKSKYITEYEVKVSVSDFKNDAKKRKSYGNKKTKYQLLEEGNHVSRFYYVVPRGLISKEDVPEFAGLIYASQGAYSGIVFEEVKSPKRLNADKISDSKFLHLLRNVYFKYHSERRERKKLKKQIQECKLIKKSK